MPLQILLIVGERSVREGLRAILASAGHEVSTAEGIAGALRWLASGEFDLLLVDVDLPHIRGGLLDVRDLLRLARVGRYGSRAILMTSSAPDLQRDFGSHGPVAVLEKPVDLSRLRRELKLTETSPAGVA
ncbi:MAG: response regulator [Candidatus Rokubacteria bacterium]|nr:response regulator [Candidatus Rokubacteria bacterium]